MVAILLITTLGLLASLIKKDKQTKNQLSIGYVSDYCFFRLLYRLWPTSGNMFQIEFLQLFLICFTGCFLVRWQCMFLLSRIFKVDADTTIIAITALNLFSSICAGSSRCTKKIKM